MSLLADSEPTQAISSADDTSEALRILHWNVHSWRDTDDTANAHALIDLIDLTNPHIVSLVEVDEPWGAVDTLEMIALRYGYSSIFAPAFEYGNKTPEGGFGNALLCRRPVRAVRHWNLTWPPSVYNGTEPTEPRSITLISIATQPPLWIGTTHLPRADAAARSEALQRLSNLVHTLESPWIVCGDYNTPPTSWLRPGDTDKLVIRPDPAQPTYPTSRPIEPIDYCLASPDLNINAEVLHAAGSDHLPVLYSLRTGGDRGSVGE